MTSRRYACRRDGNEHELLAPVAALGGFWLPTGPLDGWLWDRRCWRLVEVKRPDKEGRQDEFTPAQRRLLKRLDERGIPYHVLREQSEVLALLDGRRAA